MSATPDFRFVDLVALQVGVRPQLLQRISAVAAPQHGALSTRQARSCGLDRRGQAKAVADGAMRLVEPTVLVLASATETWLQRLWIATLALGGVGWISHRSAARLHGFDRFVSDDVECTVRRQHRGRHLRHGTLHVTNVVGPLDIVVIDGLRCTSATRTVIDLAAIGTPSLMLGAAIDSAVRLRRSAPTVIAARLAELRGPGRHGARRLDQLLMDSGGESELERRFLALLRRNGLPRPRTQVVFKDDGRHVARVDFLFEPYRVLVEVTGQRGHASPRERDRDAQRRNELTDLGYQAYEYTWAHVTRTPEYVARTMRERLIRAGWVPPESSQRALFDTSA